MIFDEQNKQYFQILQQHADKVIMEIAAHDHIADIRYHDLDISDVDWNSGSASTKKFLA